MDLSESQEKKETQKNSTQNIDRDSVYGKEESFKDLKKQLEIIYLLAPGIHQIQQADGMKERRWCVVSSPDNAEQAIRDIVEKFGEKISENIFISGNVLRGNIVRTAFIHNKDISSINHIVIDIDRIDEHENKAFCASENELQSLGLLRADIVERLSTYDIHPNYQVCSGNGYQLGLFFSAQKADEKEKTEAEKILEKFIDGLNLYIKSTGKDYKAEIDRAMAKKRQLFRLAGCWNRKDKLQEKPEEQRIYRISRLLGDVDTQLNSFEKIASCANELVRLFSPQEKPTPVVNQPFPQATITTHSDFDSVAYVREILTYNGIKFEEVPYPGTEMMFKFEECFFSDHHHNKASIVVNIGGKICYQCFVDSCETKKWPDVKSLLHIPEKKHFCKNCGAEIIWEQNTDDKWVPKNTNGSRHQCSKRNTQPAHVESWMSDKGKILPGIAANEYFLKQQETLMFVDGAYWRYAQGYWKKTPDETILKGISQMIGMDKTNKKILQDIEYCLRSLYARVENHKWNPYSEKLCFKNCVLDTGTMKMEPHNKALFQTNRLEMEYTPHGCPDDDSSSFGNYMYENAPRWMDFLDSLQFSPDVIARLQEWVGLCLIPDTRMDRCLFLKGEGRNGKSVFLQVLRSLIGENQVSSLDVTQLFDRFSKINLQNKLVNICGDIDTNVCFSAQFKGLVSGESMVAENKYKANETFYPYARLLFAGNDFPITKDRSQAFYKRFDIIEFHRVFAEEEQNKNLKALLLKELPEIMLWALEGLKRLIKNNWIFTHSPSVDRSKEEMEIATNPVKKFIVENFIISTKTDDPHWVNCDIFRSLYKSWCIDNGHQILNDTNLGKELKRLGIIREKQSTINPTTKKRLSIYVGITPIDPAILTLVE